MRNQSALSALCLVALLSALPGVAYAIEPPPPNPESTVMTDKARQLYEEGLAAIQKSKWLEARAALVAAWSLTKHWQIAANLAGCELELGKYRDAAEHAAYYLKNAPPDRSARAEAQLNRAKEKIGTLTVGVDDAGAEVLVDEVVVGQSPLRDPIYLDPGEHRVLVRRSGRPDVVQGVTLAAGESRAITMKDEAQVPPPPVTPQKPRLPTAVLVVTGVLGAGGVAVGAGLTAAANGKGSERATLLAKLGDSGCAGGTGAVSGDCTKLLNAAKSQSTLSNAAIAGFVSGGVFAVATAGLGLWASSKPATRERTQIRVAPVVSATDRGVVMVGTW
jgi:hypothetical protein